MGVRAAIGRRAGGVGSWKILETEVVGVGWLQRGCYRSSKCSLTGGGVLSCRHKEV